VSDKYLSDALLHGEGPIDFRALTDHVIRRDRRRVWIVGAVCVVAWMLAVMIPWSTILPMMAKVVEHQAALNQVTPPAGATPQQQQEQALQVLQIVKQGTIATFVGSLASMFVAAVCTVSLILLSRRATLRQVNARLADLSAELRAFKGPR
jgi:hypothetical protein